MGRTRRLFATGLATALSMLDRRVGPGQYRGLEHPAGPLRLDLGRDGAFRLHLAIWDPVVRSLAGHRELVGRWRRTWRGLELRAPTRRLDYRLVGAVLEWQHSTLPTFADGINLRRVEGGAWPAPIQG